MKKLICACILFVLALSFVNGQSDSTASKWEFNAATNYYFFPDDFILLPVFQANKNKLHLEARYNYEDLETFSAWVGYNFIGGNEFEYLITPMIGGVVGLSDGIAPGLEITLGYKGFEFYSESEYLFEAESKDNNFYYNWTDLTYSPTDWLWFGISAQRTKLYETELDIQRGLLIGSGLKNWELAGYFYNFDADNPFFLVTLAVSF